MRRPPPTETICNDCGLRTCHPILSRALISLTAHECETGHDDQMLSTPSNAGWIRFKPLDLTNAYVD